MQELTLVMAAATEVASVALIADDALVTQELVPSRDVVTGNRTEGLMPAIAKCLYFAEAEPKALTAIVCGSGPGGFTSLRSAAAIAKGMCSALHIPLYSVTTMELLIASAQLPQGTYITAIEAGRGEYYAATVRLFDDRASEFGSVALFQRDRLVELARGTGATLVGPHLEIDAVPRAAGAVPLLDRIFAGGPVDLDTWEPNYGRLAEAQVKWEAQHGRPLAI